MVHTLASSSARAGRLTKRRKPRLPTSPRSDAGEPGRCLSEHHVRAAHGLETRIHNTSLVPQAGVLAEKPHVRQAGCHRHWHCIDLRPRDPCPDSEREPNCRGGHDGPERASESKEARLIYSPTLRRAWPRDGPEAAICVQGVDVQCVLQFTLIHAASCALHRRTSQVIHRSKLFSTFVFAFPSANTVLSQQRAS